MKKSLRHAVAQGVALLMLAQAGSAIAATEGVEYQIKWDSVASVYRVYMRPIATPAKDLTTSSQITLRVPHAEIPDRFIASSITSKHAGVTWSNSSKVYAPTEDKTVDYLSFTANISDSQIFAWQAGVEQEVFNFKNTGKCIGVVEIMNNDTDPFNNPAGNSVDTNPGNEFSNLSWDAPNDYAGNYGTGADCRATVTNNAPKANNDTATATAGVAQTIDVLLNDTDLDGDAQTITAVTDGDFGTVEIVANKVVYTPLASFTGTDSFTYTISDGKGGSSTGTVSVTVNADTSIVDTDKDGVSDVDEESLGTDPDLADSDGDGVPDGVEVGADPAKPVDTDGDGTINALDTDDDGDGVPTAGEDRNQDGDKNPATQPTDTDGDGKPNYLDNDDDGDGKLTKNEDANVDGDNNPATNPLDTDGDGVPDPMDADDNTSNPAADDDVDGLTNGQEAGLGTNPKSADSDGDGIGDAAEVGTDISKPVDTDGDGKINALDADDDDDGLQTRFENYNGGKPNDDDSDADGKPDYLDADDDGDGKLTSQEMSDLNKDGSPADALDADKDGVPDYLDKSVIIPVAGQQVAVPTLSQWAQGLLTMLLGVFAFRRFAKTK